MFKSKIVLVGLLALSILGLNQAMAEGDEVVLPPDVPVCSGKACPFVIKKDNYVASISCFLVHGSKTDYNCNLTASDGSATTTTQNLGDNLDSNLTPTWLSPTLLQIDDNFKQGRAAYFTKRTVFVDFKNLEISPVFFNVYAINLARQVVLCESAMTEDQTIDQRIFIIPMFNPQTSITIERNFSGLYIHDIYSAPITHFLANGNLELVYFSRDHKIIKETISVDYNKLHKDR